MSLSAGFQTAATQPPFSPWRQSRLSFEKESPFLAASEIAKFEIFLTLKRALSPKIQKIEEF